MVSGDVVLMQSCIHLQKVRISFDVSDTVNGDAHAYSVQDFIRQYKLDQVVNCHQLVELVLEMTHRHGYAFGLQPGQDIWSNVEDLALQFRDCIADQVETEVTADFSMKPEAAAKKAKDEGREHKVDAEKTQVAWTELIAKAQTTSVRVVRITRARQ